MTRRSSRCASGWSSCRPPGTAASTAAPTGSPCPAPGPGGGCAGTPGGTWSRTCTPSRSPRPWSSGSPPWSSGSAPAGPVRLPAAALRSPALLRPTRLTAPDDRLRALAAGLPGPGTPPLEAAGQICALAHRSLEYADGVTSVTTTAAEALALGRGVCQDSAHVMLALCHLAGLPARYVSGHLIGQGGTHAWVEVIVPVRHGGGGGRVRPVPRAPGRQWLPDRRHRPRLPGRGPHLRQLRRLRPRPPHRPAPRRRPGRRLRRHSLRRPRRPPEPRSAQVQLDRMMLW